MKLLVIGHSVIDNIHLEHGDLIQPGGIFYTAAGFSSVASSKDDMYLITSSDEKSNEMFEDIFKKFDLSYSNKIDELPIVHLHPYLHKERDECYQSFTANNLEIDSNLNLQTFDGILINMITGFDVSHDQLKEIRSLHSKLIYLDTHSLARSVEDDHTRKFRTIPDAELWLKNIDILQTNESELRAFGLTGNEFEIAKKVLNYGVRILLVTKGAAGVRAFSKDRGDMLSIFEPAVKVKSINNVGCGDVFGAVFFYSYIETGNIFQSMRKANKAAAIATTYSNAKDFINLNNDLSK